MKYSTAFSGKSSLNSAASWAARILLGARTKAGLPRASMTLAMVTVFPVPVAPRRVTKRSPSLKASTSPAMALGWSPLGLGPR